MDSRTLYMHTIDGEPAEFRQPMNMIFFTSMEVSRFAGSLQQIRKEQKLSLKNRTAKGWDTPHEYGYRRIKIRSITDG